MSGSCVLGLRGRSLSRLLGGLGATPSTATVRTIAPATTVSTASTTTALGSLASSLLGSALRASAGDVALINPHLDANAAEGGAGLEEAVVDVSAQGVPVSYTHLTLPTIYSV